MEGLIMSKETFTINGCQFRKASGNDKNDFIFVFKSKGIRDKTILVLNKDKFIDDIKKTFSLTRNEKGKITGVEGNLPDYLKDLREAYGNGGDVAKIEELNFSGGGIRTSDTGIEVKSEYLLKENVKDDDFFGITPLGWMTLNENKLKENLKNPLKKFDKATNKATRANEKAAKKIKHENKKAANEAKKKYQKYAITAYTNIYRLIEDLRKNANRFNNLSKEIKNAFGNKGGEEFIKLFSDGVGGGFKFEGVSIPTYVPEKIDIPDKAKIKEIADAAYNAEYPDSTTKK